MTAICRGKLKYCWATLGSSGETAMEIRSRMKAAQNTDLPTLLLLRGSLTIHRRMEGSVVSKSVESEGWRLASSGGPEIVRIHSHAARPTGIAVPFDNAGSAGASSHGRAGPLTPSSGTRSRLTKTATDSSVETRMPHICTRQQLTATVAQGRILFRYFLSDLCGLA